jgi:hypothetical protein
MGLMLFALLAGCGKNPEKVESSTNPEIPVGKLFTHDGCIVYRFVDATRYHYFANCAGKTETISTRVTTVGKTTSSEDENIRTETH